MINNIQCCFESSTASRVANGRFYFELGQGSGSGFQRAVSFQLQDVSVPSSFLVIGDYITNPVITIMKAPFDDFTTDPIPNGNYTASELAALLESALMENPMGLTFTVTYDSALNLFTITGDATWQLSSNAFSTWLGFPSDPAGSVSLVATSVCMVSGPPCLYLQSNVLASLQQGMISSFSTQTAGIIAGVPLTQAAPGVNVYQFMLLKHLAHTTPKQIREIDLTFVYPDGRIVDLRGGQWTLNFVINTLNL